MAGRADGRAPAGPGRDPDGAAIIRPGDRVAILGRSGSGKSTLLRALLSRYTRALMLDPKRRADFGGWAIVEGADQLRRAWPRDTQRAIARPALLEEEPPWLDACCRLAYYVGSTAVGVDELAGIATASRPVRWLDVLLTRGRESGITTYVCSQRPQRIPSTVLSEAEHVFVFALNLAADRDRVAEVIGPYPEPSRRHGFVYWRPGLTAGVETLPIDS